MPYLRTSREFPEDLFQLTVEVNKTYVDVANAVNDRTISIFPTNRPAITGESYFFTSKRTQTFRQVYTFGAIAAGTLINIPDNITQLTQFTRIYGACITDLPDYRPIPYASVAAAHNIDLRVDQTTIPPSIVISVGASSPNVVSGIIVLEWY